MRRSVSTRLLWASASAGVLALVFSLTGCSGGQQSTLDAVGPGARRTEGLWWLFFGISMGIFVEVMALLGWALWRRRRSRVRIKDGDAVGFISALGVVVPLLILILVYGVGLRDLNALAAPDDEPTVNVDVVGHRWWWEIHYPDRPQAVTANEIHIPVGESVRIRLTTADVQHSFWVPQLMPKTDLIAGKVNSTWLRADRPGRYRGQCAEYCGQQHAFMALLVIAESRPQFDSWLAGLVPPTDEPLTDAEQRGRAVFARSACATCHTVRGTSATATVGPDLTNVGGRWSLGAGAAPNDPGHLGGWIVNSQTIKPGNAMPPQPVAPGDLPDLIAYLRSLG
ncbi:cytochrome c oxidase subunit II [Luedemannella flava]|uniref:cytochrome-c oxidase n=1 Tax=Luedemannella flava TaxID=349316 RepID=A0ABP4Y5K1_9ACTN